jgi:hypothetical protein
MKFVWLGLLFLMGACTFFPPVTGGTENGGTVNYVATRYGEDTAMEAAKAHCSRYGRYARELRHDVAANTLTFTCEVLGKPIQEGSRPL